MNFWKPIALCSIAALVGVVGVSAHGVQTASAAGPCKDQKNMADAQMHLSQAKASLAKAEHDKGGWRTAAAAATETALKETTRGCEFADK